MSFERKAFKDYFVGQGLSVNASNNYAYWLGKADEALGGLEEFVGANGTEGTLSWADTVDFEPFSNNRSHIKSVLRKYLQFRLFSSASPDELEADLEVEAATGELPGSSFEYEKDLQRAARQQLERIEQGMTAADDGIEISVSTGRIDILARDAHGKLVAIELKAGRCPNGALEQVLGYAEALEVERAEPVRALLVAESFSDRTRAAAKRARDVKLLRYSFALSFSEEL